MDSSDTQIETNPIEITDEPQTNEENKKVENSESSEQSNVIDVIGNGQLVKKVCTYCIACFFLLQKIRIR